MPTTKEDISEWFDRGVKQGSTHLIVVCDTYDHEDYPVFANGNADVLEKYKQYNGPNMQRVMEVYDLREGKTEQINAKRVMRLPD